MPDILELVFCRDLFIDPTSPVKLANVSQSNSTSAFSLIATRLHAYTDSPKAIKTAPQSAYKAKVIHIINQYLVNLTLSTEYGSALALLRRTQRPLHG